MRQRRATATSAPAPAQPDDGYRSLTVAEVLSDLASLNREQLLLVKLLEETHDHRAVILDRIEDLLVVQEAADHMRGSPAGLTPPNHPPHPAHLPPPPVKAVSPELLSQMDDLLAKDAARRSVVPGAAPAPTQPATPAAPPIPTTRAARRARRKAPPAAPNGHIVPTDGRRSRGGRGAKYVVALVILALVGGGGAVFWTQTHHSAATSSPSDPLAALLIAAPVSYRQQPDQVGATGPADLAQAERDDGAADPRRALTGAGFVHGYRRLWSTSDNQHQLVVTLYRFGTPSGATAYFQRTVSAARARAKPAPADFPTPRIPGAVGFSGAGGGTGTGAGAGAGGSAQSAEVFFSRGGYAATVVARGPSAAGSMSLAQRVAVEQYALLPAS